MFRRSCYIALVVLVLVLPGLGFSACTEPVSVTGAKAAIIDQLYVLQPNQTFISQVTGELEAYGFEVDLYQGDDITVDFYQQLPSLGYQFIVFRAHSGFLVTPEGEKVYRTWLFTNEPYSIFEHQGEQLADQLANARISQHHPSVFAIGSEFVTQSMEGEFNNTVIIMMGCNALEVDDLSQAFTQKGASSYLGWDGSVGLVYVDDATISLVQNLCSGGLTIERAVAKVMTDKGADPHYGAALKYYPLNTGDQTISELIK